ncbi:Cut9-interacting protein scn1 [Penicillium ucsense]|uniref:Cut9-interacting protein scn1 n=1 Tax=Penicillium ucsense TaxID=2839758 RepID=A0A8J8WMD3_9EURO|nr:Cut9-interacting protein scn1 [Penicillium ucsense]KAF7737111.1 Cut9-interacting protein scn1 [Penicillium ucsense]
MPASPPSSELQDTDAFPWDLGVYDAHCHPTDTMASIADIASMSARTLTIMATRGQDQELVYDSTFTVNKQAGHASEENKVIPAFGWHPWFSYQIVDDGNAANPTGKDAHYLAVLAPSPAEDVEFLKNLPEPKTLSALVAETRDRLRQFPHALVGEVGLDKSFRLPGSWTREDLEARDEQMTPGSREGRRLSPYKVKLDHQRLVLKAQLRLAGEMQRPVSVHSVQSHGAVFEVLRELWKGHERKNMSRRERARLQDAEGALSDDESPADVEQLQENKDDLQEQQRPTTMRNADNAQPLPFPPRICMHSYSGPVEPIRQFLHESNPSDVYFSFSAVINFSGLSSGKALDVIKALPSDRILIESDLHIAGKRMDNLLEDAARQICRVRGWELREGVQQLAENYERFIYG